MFGSHKTPLADFEALHKPEQTIHTVVFTCTVVDKIDVVSRIVESASLDNLTLVEITAAALTVAGTLKIPTNFF